jgi:hypothetical protein
MGYSPCFLLDVINCRSTSFDPAPQSVDLPNATHVDVTQFPTKVCPDGSRVHTFHRCVWNKVRTSSVIQVDQLG